VNAYGSPAWQALRAGFSGDPVGLRGGSLGSDPGEAEDQAQGSEIPWPAEQWLRGPIWWGLACSTSTGYSFSILCLGKAFHELGVQSADVSALPGALPQPRVSPASQQSPWSTELRRSAAVSLSWISLPSF
jgi:hypothetical protein